MAVVAFSSMMYTQYLVIPLIAVKPAAADVVEFSH